MFDKLWQLALPNRSFGVMRPAKSRPNLGQVSVIPLRSCLSLRLWPVRILPVGTPPKVMACPHTPCKHTQGGIDKEGKAQEVCEIPL